MEVEINEHHHLSYVFKTEPFSVFISASLCDENTAEPLQSILSF